MNEQSSISNDLLTQVDALRSHVEHIQQQLAEVSQRLALQQHESERWKFALEGSGQGVWDWNLQTNEVYYSAQWKAMLGYSDADIGDQYAEWTSRVHPDDLAPVLSVAQAHFAGLSEHYAFEHRLRCKDGSYRWILSQGRIVARNANGEALRFIGTHSDISTQVQTRTLEHEMLSTTLRHEVTDRERIEEALRASQYFNERIATQTPASIHVFDLKLNKLVYTNRAVTSILGYSIEESLAMSESVMLEIIHADDLAEFVGRIPELIALKDGEVRQWEYRAWHRTGEIRWLASQESVFERDESGTPSQILGITLDISERRNAEEALRASESQLQTILQEMPVMLNAANGNGSFYMWNSECERVTGYSVNEIVGNPQALQLLYPNPEYRNAMFMEWAARGSNFRDWELTLTAKDGGQRTVAWSNISERYPIPGWETWSIGIDVTERRQVQQQLVHLNEELEDRVRQRTNDLVVANKELESFSYSVSHDLRAPLRAIDGFSRALLEDYSDSFDDQAKHYLDRICSGVQRMGLLIDDLLKLARVARADMRHEVVNLSQICESIAAELQAQQPERQVTFQIAPQLQVRGDGRLLRIVLENMLINAWKFTSKHERANITFGMRKHEDEVIYYIEDDGAGFDLAYADKLFGPFQRLHNQHEYPGTGIGLATIQRVIHRHGGRVWATGMVDQGATFFFTLPSTNLSLSQKGIEGS